MYLAEDAHRHITGVVHRQWQFSRRIIRGSLDFTSDLAG